VEDMRRFAEALEQDKLLDPEPTALLMTGKVATTSNPNGPKYAYGMHEDFVNRVRMVGQRRRISAAARKKMSDAQKRRWVSTRVAKSSPRKAA
jgi:hypothetical protein